MNNIILDSINEAVTVHQALLQDKQLLQTIDDVQSRIARAFRNNNKIYLCGNGGSAADAQHIAAEFTGRFYKDRPAFAAEALHCNTSYLTAVANDYGFDNVYARMIEGIAQPNDILIGLSTSGNSPNIIKAFEAARKKQVTTIAFTGGDGGLLKPLADHILLVPSDNTPRIQECHILIGHIICQAVEETMTA